MNYTEFIDSNLHKLAKDGLKPDSESESKGNQIAQKIFNILQQKSRYSLARSIFGGSMGKATAIPGYDFDLVVFVNDETPPFEPILEEYEDILSKAEELKITCLKRTMHSVQFEVNGISFDLLPAANLVTGMQNLGGDDLALEQGRRVLQKIQESYRRNPKITYDYSSSLVESHILFMKRQSAFVHELARICKFWNKTLNIDAYVSGRSTIIELVATYAGISEQTHQSSSSTLRGFRRFLELMKNFDGMQIKFETEILNLSCSPPSFEGEPFLVEPSNPFNNLIKEIKPEIMEKFKKFAAETLRRLETEIYDSAKLGYFDFYLLFAPQPKVFLPGRDRIPTKCYVSIVSSSNKNPSTIVRNNKKFKKEMKDLQKSLKDTLFTAVHAFTSSGKPGFKDNEVREIVKNQIDRHAYGVESQSWGGGGITNEEDYDVTFELPFADESKVVRASFSWD